MAVRQRSTSRQSTRQINEALVLGAVHDHGPISRTDLVELTALSPASITGITAKLINAGLVREREGGVSTGGRPPVLVDIDRDAGCVIGIKLTEHQLIAALTDLGAKTLAHHTVPLGADRSPGAVVSALTAIVQELRSEAPKSTFFGVGVGLAGAIDRQAGICRFSPYLPWRDIPLGALLEARLDVPVVVENDVSALTLAERWFGGGAGLDDFVVVTLGRGVGLGMVLNGRLYRGGRGAGGEFGHITMQPDGPLCDCGKRGCLEALIGEPALSRSIVAACGTDVSVETALERARAGDDVAARAFGAAAVMLGLALSGVVNVLNPRRIIVGGEGAAWLEFMAQPLRDTLAAHCFDGLFADLDLVVEPWDDEAWARGAAGLMLDELFHAPLDRAQAPSRPVARGGDR